MTFNLLILVLQKVDGFGMKSFKSAASSFNCFCSLVHATANQNGKTVSAVKLYVTFR